MSDVFLSYAREDAERVRVFADELIRFGWVVWWDDRIRTAAEFDEVIERELDMASCVVVVWSRSSIASGWVRAEAGAANEQGKLVPVRFESDVVPPLRFRQINTTSLQTGPLTPAHGDTLRLFVEITRLTGRPPAGIDAALLDVESSGAGSGAKIVTAGKWRLRIKGMHLGGTYDLDFHPNGTFDGRAGWLIGPVAGKWIYDAALQVLQLEMDLQRLKDPINLLRIEIVEWLDNNTATGRYQRRKARLERIGG